MQQLVSIHCCRHELAEVYLAAVVDVHQLENAVNLLLREVAVELFVTGEQLVVLELSVFVDVESLKDLLQAADFLLGNHILDHHAHGGLLHLLDGVERKQVSQRLLH